MAKKSDEIERDLALKRQQLRAKTEHFRQRLRSDTESVKSAPKRVIGRSNGESVNIGMPFGLYEQVSGHPLTSVATGFGLGVALGVITDPGSSSRNGKSSSSEDSGSGILGTAMSLVSGVAGATLQDEAKKFPRNQFEGLTRS
jgi:hypothetical protein